MAKRYISAIELANLVPDNGTFKPTGTLGRHNCKIKNFGEYLVVEGRNRSIKLMDGDTLGYDCGNVWRMIDPDKLPPIKRLCRLAKIKLIETNDKVVLNQCGIFHPHWFQGVSEYVEKFDPLKTNINTDNYGGDYFDHQVDGNIAILVFTRVDEGRGGTFPTKLILRTGWRKFEKEIISFLNDKLAKYIAN